jgi:hypothetical protein
MFEPYKNKSTNLIYNLLFCDDLELYRQNHQGATTGYWEALFSAKPDESVLRAIAADEKAETRIRILAGNRLKALPDKTSQKQILGTIVEVAMPTGLDVIAAYQDSRARYINYSERLIIWEAPNSVMNERILKLLAASQLVVNKIGPWAKKRLAPPAVGYIRLTFLVNDGLYFGQAPSDVLVKDPMGGPVIKEAMELMIELIGMAKTSQH